MTEQQLHQAFAYEFARLNISTDSHPYSGLTVQALEDSGLVNIYDLEDGDSDYNGEAVLAYLTTLQAEDVSLDCDNENNVWQLIRCFEA